MRLWIRNNTYYVTIRRGVHRSLGIEAGRKKAEQEAKSLVKDLERAELEKKLIILDKKLRLSEFVKEYLDYRAQVSASTFRADALALRKFQDFYGDNLIGGIANKTLDKYLSNLASKGLKANSVNNYIRHLKIALKRAIKWGYIKNLDLSEFRCVKVDHAQIVYAEQDEIEALIKLSQADDNWKLAIPVMFYCGLPVSDLVKPVVIKANSIEYRRQKTGKFISVPRHPDLNKYLPELPGVYKLVPWNHPNTITHQFKKLAERAGCPHITPHKARHTLATWLLEAGADIITVQEILGHSDPSITKKFYGHVTEKRKRDAMNNLRFGNGA